MPIVIWHDIGGVYYVINTKMALHRKVASVMALATILLVGLFQNCSEEKGSSSGTKSTLNSADLFRYWTREDGLLAWNLLNFDNDSQPSFSIVYIDTPPKSCACKAFFEGDGSSGIVTVYDCHISGAPSGDPGCAAWNANGSPYSYMNDGTTLKICSTPSNNCGIYKYEPPASPGATYVPPTTDGR